MSTCPLDMHGYPGNCAFCSQKDDCVLLTILQKVQDLETAVQQLTNIPDFSAAGQVNNSPQSNRFDSANIK